MKYKLFLYDCFEKSPAPHPPVLGESDRLPDSGHHLCGHDPVYSHSGGQCHRLHRGRGPGGLCRHGRLSAGRGDLCRRCRPIPVAHEPAE